MEATKWLKPSVSVSRIGDTLVLGFEALRLAQQLAKLLIHRDQLIPLCNHRIALGEGVQRHRPQCIKLATWGAPSVCFRAPKVPCLRRPPIASAQKQSLAE